MSVIKHIDFIKSVHNALQFISCHHPVDFIQAMGRAYELERSPAAKDALAQILVNSRMAFGAKRPICSDTGIVCVMVKIGMGVRWDTSSVTVQEMVDEGVRQAYLNKENPLRASIVSDPLGERLNTRDNTPAVVHTEMVAGDEVLVEVSAKGGGSEFKSQFKVLNPSDSLVDWVLDVLPKMGAGWCPPGLLGIGVGGSAEKAMLLAKLALNKPIDIQTLIDKGPSNRKEELRLELYQKINTLGIGAQGLGGLTTVLDVKISDYPTHIACLPVALIPNCIATRHIKFSLDGSGAAEFSPPDINDWPDVAWSHSPRVKHLNVDTLTRADLAALRSGDTVLLSGKILTGRDATHKRIVNMLARGEDLPVDFHGRIIFYTGPITPIAGEVIGPVAPTTSLRMDKFSDVMLSDKIGVFGMIGKAERGADTVAALKQHKAVYFQAVGGAGYLHSKSIKSATVLAFADLGTEAIHEFEVADMPVTVAVDTRGNSVHESGPKKWREFPVAVECA